MDKNGEGITFNYISEEDAADYLSNINNYMRTASYRKNYTKVQGGKNDGYYENLDFAYLKELSTIDMYLRFIIQKMCLDIEHALKVRIIHDIENDIHTDGYDIVSKFLNGNNKIVNSIASKSNSPFTGDLIRNYFSLKTTIDPTTGKDKYTITNYSFCPAWVIVEILSYGEFISFYEFYYGSKCPVGVNLLHLVRSLRNGTAHNNCMIANLDRGTSLPPAEIKEAIKNIPGITKTQRLRHLSTRPTLEFTTMIYVYKQIVTEKVSYHHSQELKALFLGRMIEKEEFFKNNSVIRNTYNFTRIVINNLL